MKLIFSLLIVVLSFSFAIAQNDFTPIEGSIGYSHQIVGDTSNSGFDDSAALKGFDASVTKNLTRYVGIRAAFSGAYRKDDFQLPSLTVFPPGQIIRFSINTSVYTYMGGVQIKDNSRSGRFKPFAYAMAGGGTLSQNLSGQCPNDVAQFCDDYTSTSTGLSTAFGGGLDIKLNRKISIRAIQADYSTLFIDGDTVNNVRIGAGIVFH